jgi:RNA-directed DNA polymerase
MFVLTVEDLRSAKTYQDLAKLFGLPEATLLPALYGSRSGYKKWSLRKKNGRYRKIASPRRHRRKIQNALKTVLDSIYRAPYEVHGFVKHRGITSNASRHIGQRTVINLDLLDCFGTITFYRVRGLFLSQPFAFSWVTANVLAQACTCDGLLPAGGITSPTITNLLLASMDKRLARLAGKHGGRYTRYVDDITLSFHASPARLTEFTQRDAFGKYEIAAKLATEIAAEGFSSNPEKFRVSTGSSRKMVTGLVVNERLNLPRRWIRKLECEIYAMEKFGVLHLADPAWKGQPDNVRGMGVLRRIHGKLAYAAMVRGKNDWIAAGLAHRFNKLHDAARLKAPDVEHISRESRCRLGVWIVAAGRNDDDLFDPLNGSGTGFTGPGGFIVTAHHVIVDEETQIPYQRITVRRDDDPMRLFDCELVAGSAHLDIAILQLKDASHDLTRIRFELGKEPKQNTAIRSMGYPDYHPGNSVAFQGHSVTAIVVASAVRKVRVTGEILGGMSGGPVLDDQSRIVGVVHRGRANAGFANELISAIHLTDLLAPLLGKA